MAWIDHASTSHKATDRQPKEVRIREFGGPGKKGDTPGYLYVTVHVGD
ncbi:hypothetical protein [Streptomyces albidochromogenes]|uniref:Uncharacterized protein n=1 Tax=Streptomyces albidochromogenes TaxID=329524 RepID=A0ABW6FDM5_9ACTN